MRQPNKLEDPKLSQLRKECEDAKIPLISIETEDLILSLIKSYSPKKVLEIGTGAGYSSILILKTLPEVQVTSLELIEKRRDLALKNFERFGVSDRIQLIFGNALETIQEIDGTFDLAFVDAAKSHYMKFYKYLKDMGVRYLIFDNIFLEGRTFSDELITKRRQKTTPKRMREFLKEIKGLDEEGVLEARLYEIGDGVLFIENKKNCMDKLW